MSHQVDEQLVARVQDLVNKKLRPNAVVYDAQRTLPEDFVEELKKLGLFGLNIPKRFGGLEANRRTIAAVTEELSYGSLCVSSLIGSHLRVAGYIANYGTQLQKEKYLKRLAAGDIAAHCNNERNAKSYDTYSTTLQQYGQNQWIVNGRKDWVTSSREADIFAVTTRFAGKHPIAAENSLVIVLLEKGHPGLSVGEDIPRMGVTAVSLAPVILQNCIVNQDTILGNFQVDGRNVVETAKFGTYVAYSARSIGVSRDLLDRLKEFIQTRERSFVVGGLAKQGVVRNKIAGLDTKITAAKSLLELTLNRLEQQQGDVELLAAECKVFCTDTAKEVSAVVSQIFGASGYTREFGIERIVRDVASLGIIGSPNDIVLEKIASKLIQTDSVTKNSSVILKFADKVVPYIPFDILKRTVLGETLNITPSETYKGVHLSFLDLSTGNPTGTFKDKLACITLAHCLQHNIPTFCYQSSGNTAMSFAKYANHVGVKAILFYPKRNAYKIDQTILGKNVTSIELDGSEADLKATLARFSKLTGIPVYPSIKNQLDGNKFRAYYLHDHFIQTGRRFDWHVQSLSSAFGPFGYYQGFEEISSVDPTFPVPKLMGVQQEAVCPYVRRFGEIPANHKSTAPVIEPTLFRSQPTEDLYDKMKHILTKYGGRLDVLLNEDFYKYQSFAIKMLQRKGIDLSWVTVGSQPHLLEAAGVISLCAVLKAIDDGKIEAGTSMLVSITGGTRTPPAHRNIPKYEITPDVSDETLIAIGKDFHSRL